MIDNWTNINLWTRLHFYTSNIVFLISTTTWIFISLISLSSLQKTESESHYIYIQWRGKQQAPPKCNYQFTWHYIPKDRNLHQYHSEPHISSVEFYFHCSVAQQERLLHSDITRCIWPLNNWIKCTNLGSALPSFRGGI